MDGGIGQGSWSRAARGSFPETTPSTNGGCRFLFYWPITVDGVLGVTG